MNQSSLWQWRPTCRNTTFIIVIFFLLLLVALLAYMGWFDVSIFYSGFSPQQQTLSNPLNCGNQTQFTCPISNYSTTTDKVTNPHNSFGTMCPSYFRWIHEDLRPWRGTGITKDMVELARNSANFRLVIVNGKAYLQKYMGCYETRDMFSLWGILQLLRRYPGRLPDLDMMFECGDLPRLPSRYFQGPEARRPPLFRYCSDEGSLDIVFPDWSFWGWPEVNIRPWTNMLKDIKEGSKRIKWEDRVPYAYWKGNPYVCPARGDLMKCKVSSKNDWNARLYTVEWGRERRHRFKQSNLQDQCTHRYKIYIEGRAWSVSEKYILACDSMTLYVKSRFFDFFSRGLLPLQHYWPIRDDRKCSSLMFAVEWGNTHPAKVELIRRAAVKFIEEDLKMDYVYDYMFHLLNEYAKLLKFKPEVPEGAVELCPEGMACPETGKRRKFMEESLVTSPSDTVPCTLPPPYNATEMRKFLERKANATNQVEMWEMEPRRAILNVTKSNRTEDVENAAGKKQTSCPDTSTLASPNSTLVSSNSPSLRSFWGLFLIAGVTGVLALVYFDPGILCWKRILQVLRNFDQRDLTSDAFRQRELRDHEDRNIETIPIKGAAEAPAEDPNDISGAAASTEIEIQHASTNSS